MLEMMSVVCMVLAWLVPTHFLPWYSFYNDLSMAMALALMAIPSLKGKSSAGLIPTAWCAVAAAMIPAWQWLLGQLYFSGDAYVSSLYLLGFAAAIHVGSSRGRIDAPHFAFVIALSTLIAGVVSSFLAVAQVLDLATLGVWTEPGNYGMRAHANLAQPNNLATLIGFATASLLLLREQRRLGPVSGAALLAVLLLGAGLTQSRAALLFGPLTVALIWILKRRGLLIKTGVGVLAATSAAHWLLTWALPSLQELILPSAPLSLAERGVGSIRFQMWPLLLDALSDAPWTGYGWLQVAAAEMAVADRHPPVGELWMQGHNLFLELLIWCGYPLGLLLCAAIVYWCVRGVRRVSTVEGAVGLVIIGMLGAHSMLELPYHYAYFLLPAGLWIGIVESSIGAQAVASAKWAQSLVLGTFALACLVVKDYPEVEEDFRLVRFEVLKIGSIHATQPAPHAPFLSSLTGFLRFSRIDPVAAMSAQQLDEMKAVTQRYPYPGSILRCASAFALNGRAPEARQMFIRMQHVYGEKAYRKIRRDLHERITKGEAELAVLENALPD